jgi:hypothetical protein
MAPVGFVVTKSARRAARIGGHLRAEDKARANRKNRRHVRALVHVGGADADVWPPKLWTDWDVI